MNSIDKFKPLSNSTSALEIGDLEISNDENMLVISGSLYLVPDKESIERAESLSNLFKKAATELKKAMDEGRTAKVIPTTGTDEFGLPM